MLTWKTFTADLYEHKHKKNRLDRDQYLYKDRHDAIISVEKFEAVQVLLENRKHHVRGGMPSMQVIDEGIFRGFIPINHHWVNDDPNVYYDISNSIHQPVRLKQIPKKRISRFNLEGYQVVRGQFTQVRYEGPAITITDEKVSFNKFCMKKFDSVAYIQLLLHPAERKIAIRPCQEHDTHSIRWRPDPERALYSKSLNCQHFGTALYKIMEWNPDYMYRIRGTWAKRGLDEIIVFNLVNASPAILVPVEKEDSSAKRRVSLYPDEWMDDFGEECYEHTLDNGFYYLTPDTEWKAQAASIPAPGIAQISVPTTEELQMSIELLLKGASSNDG